MKKVRQFLISKKNFIGKMLYLSDKEKIFFFAGLGLGVIFVNPLAVSASSIIMIDGIPLSKPELSLKHPLDYLRSYGSLSSWSSFFFSRKTTPEFTEYVLKPLKGAVKPITFLGIGTISGMLIGGFFTGKILENIHGYQLEKCYIEASEDLANLGLLLKAKKPFL